MSKISRHFILFELVKVVKLVKVSFIFATRKQLISLPQDFSTGLYVYTERYVDRNSSHRKNIIAIISRGIRTTRLYFNCTS